MRADSSFGFRMSISVLTLCGLLILGTSSEAATTYFSADAESGTVNPPWGTSVSTTDPTVLSVTNSTERPHGGSRSLRHFDPCGTSGICPGNGAKVHKFPQLVQAYYSSWFNIAQGFNSPRASNTLLQLKADSGTISVKGGPKISTHINVTTDGTKRYLTLTIVDCELTLVELQTIPGFNTVFTTETVPTSSTAPACKYKEVNPTHIPNNQWFHLEYYAKATKTNGHLILWMNGRELMNLSHPKLDTLTRWGVDEPTKRSDNQWNYLIVGNYPMGSGTTCCKNYGDQLLYTDDALITDYQVSASLGGGLPGDLDADQDVDLADLRLLIEMIVGQTPPDLAVADLDSDGQLTLGDVRELINILISP